MDTSTSQPIPTYSTWKFNAVWCLKCINFSFIDCFCPTIVHNAVLFSWFHLFTEMPIEYCLRTHTQMHMRSHNFSHPPNAMNTGTQWAESQIRSIHIRVCQSIPILGLHLWLRRGTQTRHQLPHRYRHVLYIHAHVLTYAHTCIIAHTHGHWDEMRWDEIRWDEV